VTEGREETGGTHSSEQLRSTLSTAVSFRRFFERVSE
jgi:hypothetical protein